MKNLIQKAILKAMEIHKGEVRKGDGKTPYVLHPIEVGIILSHYTTDENLISAAILHDIVETGKATIEEIKNEFGEEIAKLVEALTENGTIQNWTERKGENIGRLRNFKDAYIIKAADSLANMKDLISAIENEGENVWNKFNAPKGLKMAYFTMILEDLEKILPIDLLKNYISTLKDLEYSHLIAGNTSEIGYKV